MYCSQENIKIINLIVAFSIAFFVRLLFNSSAYNIRSHYQISLALLQLLLGCLLLGIHLYTFYTEMSIRYRESRNYFSSTQFNQTYLGDYIPTYVPSNLKWFQRDELLMQMDQLKDKEYKRDKKKWLISSCH